MISPESLSVLFPNHRYGSGIQDDEDRSWSGDDACDEARAGDEVDRAGGCSASFGCGTLKSYRQEGNVVQRLRVMH
ncbi:hypothetical protein FF1_024293 [Malus domestica]